MTDDQLHVVMPFVAMLVLIMAIAFRSLD